MPRAIEVSGITVVVPGSFNPAIFHPGWFASQGLIAESDAAHGLEQFAMAPQLAAFTAGWLTVQITQEQGVFSTVEEGREQDLRDLVFGVFELLPHTPTDAVGLNSDAHFRVDTPDDWHRIGDRFLPKEPWQDLFEDGDWAERSGGQKVGMRSMVVEVWHENLRDFMRVEVAPSTRLAPNGIYVGINAHTQLSNDGQRGTGEQLAESLRESWAIDRTMQISLRERILEWT